MSDGYYEVDEQDTVVTDGHGDAAYSVDIADNQGDYYHEEGYVSQGPSPFEDAGTAYHEVDGVDAQGDAVHGVQVTDAYGDTYTEVDAVDANGNAVVYQEYDGYVGN